MVLLQMLRETHCPLLRDKVHGPEILAQGTRIRKVHIQEPPGDQIPPPRQGVQLKARFLWSRGA
jgi:hypothetical protein